MSIGHIYIVRGISLLRTIVEGKIEGNMMKERPRWMVLD